MTRRYTGGFLSAKEQATDANTANGIFSVQDAAAATAAGAFPTGRWTPQRSLRFRAANQNYLNRTFGTPTNNKVWTWSAWIKRGSLTLADADHLFFASPTDVGANPSIYARLVFETDGTLRLQSNNSASEVFTSSALFRDPSAWYHIVLYMDAVNTTVRCYVNGSEITYASRTNPTNANTAINGSGNHHRMGFFRTAEPRPMDGYMADVNFIDGQALLPSAFGMTDPQTGTWIPKRYSGTYGNNGYYLDFRDNTSPTNLALDRSGNGNNWTQNNFSVTAGTTYDSMVDVPGIASVTSQPDIGGVQRGNYPVLSPISVYNGGGTLSNGNLSVSYSDTANNKPTMAVSSGKWYTEVTCTSSGGYSGTGLSVAVTSPSFDNAFINAWYYNNGQTYNYATDSYVSYGATWGTGDVIGVAWDCDNRTVTFYKNGVSQGLLPAGVIYINENGIGTGTSVYPSAYGTGVTSTFTVNYGQRPFAHIPPAGFKSLCSTNLPNPVIKRPSDHFDVKTWTGNGTGLTVGTTAKQSSAYAINKSLRFRRSNSATLSRTPSVSGNRKVWTWSAWVKRGSLGGTHHLFSSPSQSGNDGIAAIYFQDNQLHTYYDTSGANPYGAVGPGQYVDTTAWMNIVWAVDAANTRHSVWVNGVLVSTDASYYPPNYDYSMNRSGYTHLMGAEAWGATNYFDGYMAEVNFVDGQALTPSSFGAFDANNNWVPQRYAGTYGTNGFYLPFTAGTSTFVGSYNGSTAWFNAANNAAFAFGTGSLTVEAWVYPTQNSYGAIFDTRSTGSGGPGMSIYANSGNGIILVNNTTYNPSTYLSLNQWSHIAAVRNGASAWTVYINGISVLTFTDSTNLTDNACFSGKNYAGSYWFGGFISNLRVVKGTAVYTSNFTPATSPLTNISGTSLLTLQNSTLIDNSTNAFSLTNTGPITTLGAYIFNFLNGTFKDSSPQGNNWTYNNMSVALGPTLDIMLDSPADTVDSDGNINGNYCTLNPNSSSATLALTDGNLSTPNNQDNKANNGTIGVSTGKWYWEVTVNNNSSYCPYIGVTSFTQENNPDASPTYPATVGRSGIRLADPYNYKNYTATSNSTASSTNQGLFGIVGVALNLDAGEIKYYKNNTLFHTDNSIPLNGTVLFPYIALTNSGIGGWNSTSFNFGQRPFAYTPPTGFKTLNSKNLKDVGSYNLPDTFGNFVNTPDLVWIKSRTSTYRHQLLDTVRGPRNCLFSSDVTAQQTFQSVQSFIPNGITLGTETGTNETGGSHVGWFWNRGKTPGFDIVTYGGDGVNGRMIPHNLGQAPAFYITKCLTN